MAATETLNAPKITASEKRRRELMKHIIRPDTVDQTFATPDPQPPAETPPEPPKEDPTVGMSFGDLAAHTAAAVKDAPPPKEEPKVEPPKEPSAAAPVAEPPKEPSPEPPKEEPTKVVRRKPEPVAAPTVEPPKPAPAPAPEPIKSIDERAGFVLSEEEREYLDIAAYAETKDPAKKGLVDRELNRIRRVHERIESWEKAHDGQPFNPQTDTEAAEVARKFEPAALTGRQMRELDRQRIKDEVEADVRKSVASETTGKLSEVETKLRRIEVEPMIEREVKAFEATVLESLPEDIRPTIKDKGVDEFKKADRLEGRIVERGMVSARRVAEAIGRLANGLENYSEGDEYHRYAMETLTIGERYLKSRPIEQQTVDGKRFVSADEWLKIAQSNPAKLQEVWTFNSQQWMEIARGRLGADTAKAIKDHREDVAASGLTKKVAPPPAAPPPKAGDEPPKEEAPKVAPKPSGGQPKTQGKYSAVDRYLGRVPKPA